MKHARHAFADLTPDAPPAPDAPQSVASWYTPGFSDGLGDRLLMFDNSTESSLELLRFNRRLGDRAPFEKALRHRVHDLKGFQHPSIAPVRAVEWLGPGDGLALISNHTTGRRLSEVLHDARGAAIAMELVRQLTPALAALQSQGPRMAHGALTTDRIVVTPDGRLVIVEHVLGSALEAVDLPAGRARTQLGIVLRDDRVTLDPRNDVIQLGLIALSLLLGRRLDPVDYPHQSAALLAEFAWSHRGASASGPLKLWLEGALQLGGRVFDSALEAQEALAELPEEIDSPAPIEPRRLLWAFPPELPQDDDSPAQPAVGARQPAPAELGSYSAITLDDYPTERPAPRPSRAAVAGQPAVHGGGHPAGSTSARFFDRSAPFEAERRTADPEPFPMPIPAAVAAPADPEATALETRFAPTTREQPDINDEEILARETLGSLRRRRTMPHWSRWLTAALIILVVGQAVFIAGMLYGQPTIVADLLKRLSFGDSTPPPVAPASSTAITKPASSVIPMAVPSGQTPASPGTSSAATSTPAGSAVPATRIEISSDPAGARVTVDGTPRGATPLSLVVTPGAHTVIVSDGSASSRRNVNVAAGTTAAVVAAFVPSTSAAGWVAITSPIELQVAEGGDLIGTTSVSRLMLPAGRHELEVSSAPVAFSTKVTVDVAAGKTSPVTVTLPIGSISINALPWATVWLDGRSLGTTPVANMDVQIGSHEVIWRHPQLGERRQTVTVTAREPLRLMLDMGKK